MFYYQSEKLYIEEKLSSYVETRHAKAFHKIIIYVYNIIENKNVECCKSWVGCYAT